MRNNSPLAIPIQRIFDSAKGVKTFVFHVSMESFPGQFVMVWIPGKDEKPFSISRDKNGEFWLMVADVGPFSHALCSFRPGDTIGIRGPFGKGYSLPKKKNIVLVGGGYGMAPLHNCGVWHLENGNTVTAITGARSGQNVLFEKECSESGFRTFVTTDDGSKGERGFVTHILERLLMKEKIDLVQTCGPEKMMKVIAEMCVAKSVPCEVSLERYMKCGFGVCGQCTVDGTGERMCREGPVQDGAYALQNFSDFGKYHRGAEGQKILW
ncbi:dihydroorotate dehydrogenase electron transfer subunit [Candidatus Peregrinibacteria bacterium]|nr:dihydroorotate dehydrogenase electron transfer subunit [Candidatus Peregrinibacteria bacterium]